MQPVAAVGKQSPLWPFLPLSAFQQSIGLKRILRQLGRPDFWGIGDEAQQVVEVPEEHQADRHAQVIPILLAGGKLGAAALIGRIAELKDLVNVEGQQVQDKKNHRQVKATVAEVVLDVVALIFQRIEGLVFDLPARPSGLNQLDHIGLLHTYVGHPAVVVPGRYEPFCWEGVTFSGHLLPDSFESSSAAFHKFFPRKIYLVETIDTVAYNADISL